eukprot:331440-Pelagomonas_calceolata.AAC.1
MEANMHGACSAHAGGAQAAQDDELLCWQCFSDYFLADGTLLHLLPQEERKQRKMRSSFAVSAPKIPQPADAWVQAITRPQSRVSVRLPVCRPEEL